MNEVVLRKIKSIKGGTLSYRFSKDTTSLDPSKDPVMVVGKGETI